MRAADLILRSAVRSALNLTRLLLLLLLLWPMMLMMMMTMMTFGRRTLHAVT